MNAVRFIRLNTRSHVTMSNRTTTRARKRACQDVNNKLSEVNTLADSVKTRKTRPTSASDPISPKKERADNKRNQKRKDGAEPLSEKSEKSTEPANIDTKPACKTARVSKSKLSCQDNNKTSNKLCLNTENISKIEPEDIKIQQEPQDVEDLASAPSLARFKFMKMPHAKHLFYASLVKTEEVMPIPKVKGEWEPPNWRQLLVNMRQMRSERTAPVDTTGFEKCVDDSAPPEVMRYQALISLMLSSQTKDQVAVAAMKRLTQHGLTIDNILQTSDEKLGKLIHPVAFWRRKVIFIKKTTHTLKSEYGGDIPDTLEKLCKLTGVGPKMAHLCMSIAWGKITGIGVDTHVHRVSNRVGWVRKPATTPEDTRKALEAWLPFEIWSEVNLLMVGFGQTICKPINPECSSCLNKEICPYGIQNKSEKGKKNPVKISKKIVT